MTWIELGEPSIRKSPTTYLPKKWPDGRRIALSACTQSASIDSLKLTDGRRTNRQFKMPSLSSLSDLLWMTCRTMATEASPFGFCLHYRPLPSGGAIHPIHVVLQFNCEEPWWRYDPIRHEIVELSSTKKQANEARTRASEFVGSSDAVLLGFVAEPGKTAAKYERECSIIWRDAGVLLGYMSLISEVLGLNFCPLGITGEQYLAELDSEGLLRGVGLALLGAR